MSTAVASAMPAPLHSSTDERSLSPKSYPKTTGSSPRHVAAASILTISTPIAANSTSEQVSPKSAAAAQSPTSERKNRTANRPPAIPIKKEPPGSPDLPTSRHRPRKLDLSKDQSGSRSLGPRTGGQVTGRDTSGGLAMHDVGLACLSPGFSTHDPSMREQLQRSISVRDQQRHIIESRLNKNVKEPGVLESGAKTGSDMNTFAAGVRTPSTSRRKAPPGLHIVPPSAEQFANERVVQSAPLHQTFTGRHQPNPLTRHVANQPSNLSSTSHIHHVPAQQTQNRLPPISDVFAQEGVGGPRENGLQSARGGFASQHHSNSTSNSSHSNHRPQFPSPRQQYSRDPPTAPLARPREFRTSEEAITAISGGREDLIPKIVHYGGHQPPTPPSPLPPNGNSHSHKTLPASGEARPHAQAGRRRTRVEYEENSSPPLGRREERRPVFEERGRDVLDLDRIGREKKEKFMSLISEAWDVLHS